MDHIFKQYPNSLRKHRKNIGLRQQDVARHLGLNTTERISKWENGHNIPALRSLFKLAALYHVSPMELYDEMSKPASAQSATSSSDDASSGERTQEEECASAFGPK